MTQNYKIMNYVQLVKDALSHFSSDFDVVKTKGARLIRVYSCSSMFSGCILDSLGKLPPFELVGVTSDVDGTLYVLLSY